MRGSRYARMTGKMAQPFGSLTAETCAKKSAANLSSLLRTHIISYPP